MGTPTAGHLSPRKAEITCALSHKTKRTFDRLQSPPISLLRYERCGQHITAGRPWTIKEQFAIIPLCGQNDTNSPASNMNRIYMFTAKPDDHPGVVAERPAYLALVRGGRVVGAQEGGRRKEEGAINLSRAPNLGRTSPPHNFLLTTNSNPAGQQFHCIAYSRRLCSSSSTNDDIETIDLALLPLRPTILRQRRPQAPGPRHSALKCSPDLRVNKTAWCGHTPRTNIKRFTGTHSVRVLFIRIKGIQGRAGSQIYLLMAVQRTGMNSRAP